MKMKITLSSIAFVRMFISQEVVARMRGKDNPYMLLMSICDENTD